MATIANPSPEGTIYASAARTATPDPGDDMVNAGYRGVTVVLDITAVTATPAITVTIQGKDPASGQYYTILASAAIATVSTTVLRVGPGLTAAANTAANFPLPRTWRVIAAHGDADSATYTVGYSLHN